LFFTVSRQLSPRRAVSPTPAVSRARKLKRSGRSGSKSLSPGTRPLRTGHERFPSSGSSRLTSSHLLLVLLVMAYLVEPLEVFHVIPAPRVYRDAVMEMDLLTVKQGLSAP
jgi:hypothetical protein